MRTVDLRNENFEALFARVTELRFAAWAALKMYGPGTTREIAAASRMDLLTFRPRVTELCDLGFAYLAGRAGREGVYAARDYEEARAWHAEATGGDRQLELSIMKDEV